MKINIEMDMTPEEAKKLCNIPDFGTIIEERIKEIDPTEYMSKYLEAFPKTFDYSNWFKP